MQYLPGENQVSRFAVQRNIFAKPVPDLNRKIGADDNLFEVGVSSLTLTEVVLAIDEKYPGKLDISDLFDYPTLREIAAFLKRDT